MSTETSIRSPGCSAGTLTNGVVWSESPWCEGLFEALHLDEHQDTVRWPYFCSTISKSPSLLKAKIGRNSLAFADGNVTDKFWR
jgi:hypothetical protein